jgi:hypothetical protein
LILGGLLLVIFAKRMPARTASGTAMLRRIRGFRRVIETAETHMSQWAEKEMIFTTFLPYAVVFGCTDKWAKAFAALGVQPDTSWYVSPRPFVFTEFAQSMDGFAVTTGGMIASTPSGSGSSGFGGGGFSGGGAAVVEAAVLGEVTAPSPHAGCRTAEPALPSKPTTTRRSGSDRSAAAPSPSWDPADPPDHG